uniref:TOG domain-containing protein n=1 Tax=Chlamydomonas euryale TaxID=1486919 RepID=A0A7R9V0M6_9CHLO|mmetsp:Transcript_11530/g.34146  ORF Transcript_11530/g.34146 Transcript_11530/m.34146 type:complete len:1109 (+) Transcript_11530:333-3659(+)
MESADVSAALSGGANFETLVAQLMLPDNEGRSNAEALFARLKAHPDALSGCLLATMRTSGNMAHRQFAAVMLKRVLCKDDPPLWAKCSAQVQAHIKNELLAALQEEADKSVASKVCDTIAEVASEIFESPGWPELPPFLFGAIQSGQPRLMEASLVVLASLAEYHMEVLRTQLPTLVQIFGTCLGHASHEVQLASLRAISNFIQALDEPSDRDKFSHMIPGMLACIGGSLNRGDELAAQEGLEVLIEVAEAHPRFLRKQLVDVVQAVLQIARAEQLDDATRQLAAEFLVTLCEAREKAPGMMRKLPNFVPSLFEMLMTFLMDVEDDPLWHSADTDQHEEAGAGDRFQFGQECLDRISMSLGGNAIVPAAGQLLPTWLRDADWRRRHATLICLAQIAEGCAKLMQKQLGPLTDMCLSGLQDSHPKVRWAACQALGQMCTDLGPELQTAHHAKLLPALMALMDDFNNPRVQAHACAATVNFADNVEEELLPPYLDSLIMKLLVLLQHGKKLVQEGALTAMASIADSSKALFIKYYDTVMPLLSSILVGATDKAHRLLRAKALECISLVAMAVGRDRFRADAVKVMQLLQQLQASEMDTDDPTLGYMLQAGARLCKCLGQEFLPYLEIVMPSLLASAKIEPEVKVRDAEEDNNDDEDEDCEKILVGDRLITIRTSSLEEKVTACNMLCCYAEELREGFLPYVQPVTEVMVPLLKFWFHEEVRRAAANIVPELLHSVVAASSKQAAGVNDAAVAQLMGVIFPPLIEALGKEPDVDVLPAMLDAVSSIVDVVEPSMLQEEWVGSSFEKFSKILSEADERRQERLKRQGTEDFDEEELEALEEENQAEEELFDQVATCLGTFLKKFGDAVLPYVERVMGQIAPLLDKGRSHEERRIAVCVVDDLLEHSPAGRAKYAAQVVPMLLESCAAADADLRQCSVYGLGVLASKSPELFRPYADGALKQVLAIVQHPAAKEEDNEMATDNAVSTLGKILEFHSDAVDAAAVAAAWLGALPLTADHVEAQSQHELLVRLLEARDPRVSSSLPGVAAILVRVLGGGTRLCSADVGKRGAALLAEMLSMPVPADAIATAGAAMTPKQQAALQAYMAGGVPDDA